MAALDSARLFVSVVCYVQFSNNTIPRRGRLNHIHPRDCHTDFNPSYQQPHVLNPPQTQASKLDLTKYLDILPPSCLHTLPTIVSGSQFTGSSALNNSSAHSPPPLPNPHEVIMPPIPTTQQFPWSQNTYTLTTLHICLLLGLAYLIRSLIQLLRWSCAPPSTSEARRE